MLALAVEDVKGFMVKLLKEDVFDEFWLKSCCVDSFARFEIYGTSGDEGVAWSRLREYVFGVVRGGAVPRSMKIVFGADGEKAGIEGAGSGFVNILFEGGKVGLTTGLSKKSFSLDRSDEQKWDEVVVKFLGRAGIKYTSEI